MAILAELKDPRVRDVTVTSVDVSPDMRLAKIYVSVMGDDTKQQLTLRGLQNAAGFLQSKVGKRIETRYTPRLEFVLDLGVKRSIEIARILREVLPETAGESTATDQDELDQVEAGQEAQQDEADGDSSHDLHSAPTDEDQQ